MKYKMIVFDLDGTILNTIGDLCASCNYALREYGLESITEEQTKQFLGHGIKHLIYEASKRHPQADEILKIFKEYYAKNFNETTIAYEGIYEVFSYCKEEELLLGVVTNKVEEIAKQLIETHFPHTMEFVFGDVEGRKRKPDPEILLYLLKKYNLTKEEVLYIGDSEVDIHTALNAGVDGLFVSYGFRSKEDLLRLTKKIVDKPQEIINYIK